MRLLRLLLFYLCLILLLGMVVLNSGACFIGLTAAAFALAALEWLESSKYRGVR